MAGGRRRGGRTKAQARALLSLRQRSNLIKAPASSPEHYRGPIINFESYRQNIERSIMEDHQKYQVGLSARDLYIKSNPGLLGDADYTNPRQWYNSNSKQKLISTFLSNYKRAGIHRVDNPSNIGAVYVTLPTLARKQRRESKATDYRNVSVAISKHAVLPRLPMANSDHGRDHLNGGLIGNTEGNDEGQESSAFLTSLPPIQSVNKVRSHAGPETIDKGQRIILPEIPHAEGSNDGNDRVVRGSTENVNRHYDNQGQQSAIDSKLHKQANSLGHLSKTQFFTERDDKNNAMLGSNASLSMAHERPALPNIKPTQELAGKYQSLREQKSLERSFEIDRDEYRLRQKSNLNLKMKKYQTNEHQTRVHRDIHKNAGPLDLSNVKSKVASLVYSTASTPRRLSRSEFEDKNRVIETDTKEKMDLKIAAHRCSPSNKYDVKGDNLDNNGDKSNHNEKGENHHYVYHSRTSTDGYTSNKGYKENAKAKVVMLALERNSAADTSKGKTVTADITIPHKLKFDDAISENLPKSQDFEGGNDRGDALHVSESPTKRYVQFSDGAPVQGAVSPTKGIKKTKSVLKKYTKLEVFSDGKKIAADDSERFSEVTDEHHRGGTAASRVPIGTPLYRLDTRNVTSMSLASRRQEGLMEEENESEKPQTSKTYIHGGQHFDKFVGPFDESQTFDESIANHVITEANSVELSETVSNAQSKDAEDADTLQGQSQNFMENAQHLPSADVSMDADDSIDSVDEKHIAQIQVDTEMQYNASEEEKVVRNESN